MSAFVYMLRCADGSFYVGSARGASLDRRIAEHQAGTYAGYTSARRPVTLVWAEACTRIEDAIAYERRLKGWSRAKKEALIRGDWDGVQEAAKRPSVRSPKPTHPSCSTQPPHPEAPASAGLEGEPQPIARPLEPSFEAASPHLRMR